MHTFTVGGRRYASTLHPGVEGLQISLKLTGYLAGPVMSLLDGIVESGGGQQEIMQQLEAFDMRAAGEAIGAALSSTSLPFVLIDLLAHTRVNCDASGIGGVPLDRDTIDVEFAGRVGDLYAVAAEVIAANGFVPGLSTLLDVAGRVGIDLQAAPVSPAIGGSES